MTSIERILFLERGIGERRNNIRWHWPSSSMNSRTHQSLPGLTLNDWWTSAAYQLQMRATWVRNLSWENRILWEESIDCHRNKWLHTFVLLRTHCRLIFAWETHYRQLFLFSKQNSIGSDENDASVVHSFSWFLDALQSIVIETMIHSSAATIVRVKNRNVDE